MNCNECQERVTNCGPISYAMCVRYEGKVRIGAPLENLCDINVQDVIEDLYSLVAESGNIYYNGDGILLNDNTFSLDYSKVRTSTWKPTWEDIQDKPEQLNLIEGDNIAITGTYPNLTISADSESGLSSISVEGVAQPKSSGNVDLKRASTQTFGVVKLGGNITMDINGNIIAPTYTDGLGLQKIGNEFSLGFEETGLGNTVQKVERTESGIKVYYREGSSEYTLPDASVTVKGGVKLTTDLVQTLSPVASTSMSNRTYSVQKLSSGGLVVNIPWQDTTYSPATVDAHGLVRLGSGIEYTGTVEPVTNVLNRTYAIQLTNAGRAVVNVPWTGGGTYVQGTGITISGNTISNSQPNATHTGDVTGSTSLTISNNVVSNSKLTQMPALTVKANISNSNATPQDVSIETLRGYLNIGTQTIILDSLNANVNPQSFNQTAVFCKLTVTDLTTISIEDGAYDGQQLYFQFNYYNSEATSSVELTGNLINFVPGQESTPQVILTAVNSKELFLFWSTDTNCWMTRIIPKLP